MPTRRRFLGPAVVAIAAIIMLTWSWGTWPDPLVDFGSQLYIPWRITTAQTLYRDIAWYNGPLSQYFNAALFCLFGVGLRTLVFANLAILTAVLILIYRLTQRTAGPLAAVATSLTFILIFAFGQNVPIGNYNWVTPYVHELTHGVALALLTIALIDHYQRTEKTIWLIAAGVTLGLIFLTKAEPMAAATAATIAQLITHRPTFRKFTTFLGSAAIVPLIATLLLSIKMPLPTALRGVAGSWPWLFNTTIASLPFYRTVSGLDDIPKNLTAMLYWTLGYTLLLLPAFLLAIRIRRHSKTIPAIVFLVISIILAILFFQTDWNSLIRPLPLCLAVLLIPALRRRDPLPLALIIFSLALLAKISLNAHVFHYGFVLAMPGTLVLVAALAGPIPTWIQKQNGNSGIFLAAAAAGWLAAISASLYLDSRFFTAKQWTISVGPDAFRSDTTGLEIQQMTDLINQQTPPSATLAVFPQGLMLNYLTRRPNPIPQVNFMPPEVLAAGEQTILTNLAAHPPDAIVLNTSTLAPDQFRLDQTYSYGQQTFNWIHQNYEEIAADNLLPPYPTQLHLILLRRKSP